MERVNGRLKDDFGGPQVRVRGHAKVLCQIGIIGAVNWPLVPSVTGLHAGRLAIHRPRGFIVAVMVTV